MIDQGGVAAKCYSRQVALDKRSAKCRHARFYMLTRSLNRSTAVRRTKV